MSSVEVNDENCGVIPAGKHSGLSQDIFALDQPTGRPSILRQTENLPSRTVPKGIKVCFQTPRRDPVTKRIMSPSKSVNLSTMDECTKAMEALQLDKLDTLPLELPEQSKQEMSSHPDDDMPLPSKGSYQLDFDNLDTINPIQTGGSKIQNSPNKGSNKMVLSPGKPAAVSPTNNTEPQQPTVPEYILEELNKMHPTLDDTLPFIPSVENSLTDISNVSSRESSVVTVTVPKVPAGGEQDSYSATPDEKQPTNMSANIDQDKASGSFVEDAPLPAKGCYNLDFDDLDAINPFQTGGSKIQNSPLPERKVSNDDAPAEESKPVDVEVPTAAEELPVQDVKPVLTAAPAADDPADPPAPESEPADAPVQEASVKLEFTFGDGGDVKRKPPPKRFGIRPSALKPKEEKSTSEVKASKEAPVKPDVADIPLPKGSYSLDSGKFDDPYFNPFGTKTNITNSPKCSNKLSPVLKEADLPEQTDKPDEKEAGSLEGAGDSLPAVGPSHKVIADHKIASDPDEEIQQESEQLAQRVPELLEPPQLDQKSQTGTSEISDEFVPGTMFLTSDFDGQIDYLEQFGSSSFKESALRKQSLYLKFDPLLRESPKKSAGPAAQTHVAAPAALASRLGILQTAEKETMAGPRKDCLKLLEYATTPTPLLESIIPPFPQPTNTEDAIIELLKYSQKDMDAAIAEVQAEGKVKEEQWSAKFKKLQDDGQELRKIIAEYELVIAKIMSDQEKEKELAQAKLNEALLEKEQVSNDLNTLEKSFAEIFKRLEKYKGVIEGYKKNEETLKSCAQDYLVRIKKEEQRYLTLKAHAEEKIGQANGEIAEVRSKFKGELSALQVQLRREQLKVQSLERSLEQKEKEAEELTKLCDELISKVQTG
ncbi:transforming acidic coiled-coil-containing protein 3 [Kryptolebias marmoratus]|uniref:Transforming, acidic coiled-coil containing protein 3 n=1 Tax=Kryptolebias marmoratus TaxID=37003 RepID=A0A3Q3F013_KRYMA|nr:transforming acidic coiled-coil-containing protein 3 [Kryptolebias marmoratus]XP_024860982.1 transforming acidic coiled-coil-containing protein 3 [Kryptolebias marmoratus]